MSKREKVQMWSWNSRVRWAVMFFGAVVIVPLSFYVLTDWIVSYALSQRESERHVFDIEFPQKYLSEKDAAEFARKTLVAEGYKLADWRFQKEGGATVSPDGKKDIYLSRALDPRCGRILIVKRDDGAAHTRYVELEMSDKVVTTYIRIPK